MILSKKTKQELEFLTIKDFIEQHNNKVLSKTQNIAVEIYDGEAFVAYNKGLTFGVQQLLLNMAEVNILKSKLKKAKMKEANGVIEYGMKDEAGAYIGHPKRFWYNVARRNM
jgi:hypothetical protein